MDRVMIYYKDGTFEGKVFNDPKEAMDYYLSITPGGEIAEVEIEKI